MIYKYKIINIKFIKLFINITKYLLYSLLGYGPPQGMHATRQLHSHVPYY